MNVYIYGSGRQGQRWKVICENAGHSVKFASRGWGPNGKIYEDPTPNTGSVIVATPPDLHRAPVLTALKLGIPVLVEKPLARTSAQNAAILGALMSSDVPLLVGYTHLFSEFFATPKPLGRVHIQWTGEERTDGSCSAALDWGSHAIAMATALTLWGCEPTLSFGRSAERHRAIWGETGILYEPGPDEMVAEWHRFDAIRRGDVDWRSTYQFTAAVAALANEEAIQCAF
jgi:hypothetical protein